MSNKNDKIEITELFKSRQGKMDGTGAFMEKLAEKPMLWAIQ